MNQDIILIGNDPGGSTTVAALADSSHGRRELERELEELISNILYSLILEIELPNRGGCD